MKRHPANGRKKEQILLQTCLGNDFFFRLSSFRSPRRCHPTFHFSPEQPKEYPFFVLHHLATNYLDQSIEFHSFRAIFLSRLQPNKTNAFSVAIDTKTMQRMCLMTMSHCVRVIASIPTCSLTILCLIFNTI